MRPIICRCLKLNIDSKPRDSILGLPTPTSLIYLDLDNSSISWDPKISPECSPATIPIFNVSLAKVTYLVMPLEDIFIDSINIVKCSFECFC